MFDVSDRVFVVTGAAGGLGAAIARDLATAGARLALLDTADQGRTADCTGGLALACDVRDPQAVAACLDEVVARLGPLQGLVANAGCYAEVDDLAAFRTTFETNAWGPWVCTQAAAARMAPGGAIVNIGTNVGEHYGVADGQLFYVASKAALLSLQRSLAIQLGPAGIRVNMVSPGPTRVEGGYYGPQLLGLFEAITPLGLAPGPEQVCAAVRYFLSDASRHVSGANLVIDGGFIQGYSLAAFDAVLPGRS